MKTIDQLLEQHQRKLHAMKNISIFCIASTIGLLLDIDEGRFYWLQNKNAIKRMTKETYILNFLSLIFWQNE